VVSLPSGRRLLALDAAVVLWALAWVAVGVVVALSVVQLTQLTGAFDTVGGAITSVGDTLGSLRVPIFGGPLAAASDSVSGAGRLIAARGSAVRGEIEQASVVLGAAVALIPILLVLLAYLPARLARARETTALRGLVASAGDDPQLESLLAERALTSLSYDRLRRVSRRPWKDDLVTRRALAEEELRRLGVRPAWTSAHGMAGRSTVGNEGGGSDGGGDELAP
jgi:hypothetical protein